MPSIKLKCGTVFNSSDSETILDAAKKENLHIDYSCKDGRCGVCSTKLISGTTEIIQPEMYKNVSNELILTCCRKATSNIEIDSENLYQLKNITDKRSPSKIANIEFLSPEVVKLTLRFPPNTKLDFLAGQYLSLIKGDITRSYSIASKPNQENLILYIKKYKDGQMSDYIFNKAKIDDVLQVSLPKGTFFVRESSSKRNLVLMATGTGIAPFLGILDDYKSTFENIYLFWGNRKIEDFFVDLKEKYTHLNLNYYMVTSREKHDNFIGYIQDKLFQTNINIDESSFYACGSIDMINELKNSIKAKSNKSCLEFYSDAFISSS
jgi:CDP-4-dehydro-6-deoxyglucose reductase, E3